MITAALITFAVLLTAWLFAPAASTESPTTRPMPTEEAIPEAA